nr:RNA-directed DNA polymerase, eukaryota, reverse transcriptase zinc-binding domain protein [Tanacetum cinerariifolium]
MNGLIGTYRGMFKLQLCKTRYFGGMVWSEYAFELRLPSILKRSSSSSSKQEQLAEAISSSTKKENFSSEHPNPPLVKLVNEDSSSISRPPGFKAYNSNSNRFSCGGSHQSPKQPSHYSFAPVKPSRTRLLMNIMYFNSCGLGANKCNAIAKLCIKHKVSFLGIQETHATKLDPFKIKRTWGNSQFDFVESPASGRSGGLVSIWDPNVFSKVNDFQFENLLIVEGTWIASRIHCFMINVYAPQDDSKKERLWNDIFDFMNSNRSHHLIFGDFNVVRFASERFGSVFNHASTSVFNQFIRHAHLWDILLGGHLFTRFNKHGDKLSKLDRFITSDLFAPFFQKFSGHVLDCLISNHRPILLSHASKDFGLTLFKFYNSWLLDKSLHLTIADFWDKFSPMNQANPIVSFKNKMKALKVVIKEWNLKQKDSLTREKEELSKKIMDFNTNIASRSSDFIIDSQRSLWIDRLRDIELKENTDTSQKAKIRSPFYKSITSVQNIYLASPFSEYEIKEAIWDCGSDKSPGPDGFTFAFYKEFWKVVKSDVLAIVHHFFSTGILPRGCNTSFITLIPKVPSPMVFSDFRPISLIGAQYKIIAKVLANRLARVIDTVISMEQSAFIKQRQILDGPLMVNEVIQWCKHKKSKLMVFKVDFEKNFDTISWDFLFQVLHFMGFNELGSDGSRVASILPRGALTMVFLRDFGSILGQNMALNDSEDVWVWSSGNSAFTVKDARGKIDDGFLPDDGFETRWNRPYSPNFPSLRGLFSWLDDLHISSSKKDIIEVVCGVVLWSLGNFCNDMIFGDTHPSRSTLFYKIIDFSFRWYSSRNKLSSISWNNWIQNPIEVYAL